MSHYAPGDDDTIFTGSGEPFPDWEETKREATR